MFTCAIDLNSSAERCGGPPAAARHAQTVLRRHRSHFVETLRMARHHQPLDLLRAGFLASLRYGSGGQLAMRLQHAEEFGLLALARTGEHHDRPAGQSAPGPASLQLRRIGGRVELQVAEYAFDGGAGLRQPDGIVFRLRPYRREGRVRGARQGSEPLCLRQRLVAQAGVGQRQRQAARLGWATPRFPSGCPRSAGND